PNNTGFAHPHLPAPARIVPQKDSRSHFYIRLKVSDEPGVLRDIAAIMAQHGISIAQVIQKSRDDAESQYYSYGSEDRTACVPFIMMTHEAPTSGVQNALERLAASAMVHETPVYYRVLPK
ncbi:ACT domain-containing protein, partial [Desulfovibrio sp. OttesenSCG-928-G15]|nr:ACT domain-containing protein [Desulfovibrio sp. OttesenSCG-928-G15]